MKRGGRKREQAAHTHRDRPPSSSHPSSSPPSPAHLLALLSSLTTASSDKFRSLQTLAASAHISPAHAQCAIDQAQTLLSQCTTRADLSQLKTHLYNLYRSIRASSAILPEPKAALLQQVDELDSQIVKMLNSQPLL